MSTSEENEAPQQQGGGEQGRTGATQQAGSGEVSAEHGRGRHDRNRRRGRRPEPDQRQQQQQRPPQQQQRRGGESTLNLEELRELTELFSAHGLTDFEFENADIRVRLSRNPSPSAAPAAAQTAPAPQHQAPSAAQHAAAPAPQHAPPQPAPQPEAPPAPPEEELHIITSPIVGTFYRSPAPTADPFVKAGSHVSPDTVVCIIEAMKLMNEIQAETEGTVEKIYVENGQPVEYGQPLFGVKK